MDKNKLNYFISAARHLNFTKAAEDCHVVQGTISKQIASIEDELGVKLFIRKGQTLSLTPAGQKLLDDSNDYIEQYDAIENSLKGLRFVFDDSLKTAVGTMEHPLIIEPMRKFHADHSNVEMIFSTYSYGRMVAHFRNDTLDIGICHDICADKMFDMKRIPVYSGNWNIVAHPDHPYWNMSEDARSVLYEQNIVSITGGEYDVVYRHLNNNPDFRHRRFIFSNALISMVSLIESGYGIGILPPFFDISKWYTTLRVEKMVHNPVTTGFSLVYNPRKQKMSVIEKFLQYYK